MSHMQIVSINSALGPRVAALVNGAVHPLNSYATSTELLADWKRFIDVSGGDLQVATQSEVLSSPQFLAPITAPRNIYFAGVNYRDHIEEMQKKLNLTLDSNPKASGVRPWHCMKATGSTVVGPGAIVVRPNETPMLDWEVELAVVIGITAKNVSEAQALEHVAGYTVANDLSARDHAGRKNVVDTSPFKWDWIGQKSFDGACPMGPAMTLANAVGEVQNLCMKLWVNNDLKQDSNTGQMIFSVAEQIAYLSSRITLLPGDVILTGTPSGVGMANGLFLQPGDVVRQWIESIGEFEFSVG
ncbi:MAG: ureidoglycolate lyase [Ramlibacter sp.]|nr:ureidoglycolate lyase [Ramlibacter sp.]